MEGSASCVPVAGHRRGRTWERVGYGLYRPAGVSGLVADLGAWQLILPADASFTGLTAALLRGWWTPPVPDDLPVFVAQDRGSPRSTRRGIVVARHTAAPAYDLIDGLRVARPGEVLLACARDLCLLDLVVLLDGARVAGVPLSAVEEAAARRRRGAPALRRALGLSDERPESAWEVVLRLFHRLCDAEVAPQHEVRDADGTFLARADLWLVGTRVLHEYDGEEHREKRRQQQDLRRERRLSNAGWQRRGYTDGDLLFRASSILRDIDLALGRPHQPHRIKAWNEMLRASLFTAAGTGRLRAGWGLPGAEDAG